MTSDALARQQLRDFLSRAVSDINYITFTIGRTVRYGSRISKRFNREAVRRSHFC